MVPEKKKEDIKQETPEETIRRVLGKNLRLRDPALAKLFQDFQHVVKRFETEDLDLDDIDNFDEMMKTIEEEARELLRRGQMIMRIKEILKNHDIPIRD